MGPFRIFFSDDDVFDVDVPNKQAALDLGAQHAGYTSEADMRADREAWGLPMQMIVVDLSGLTSFEVKCDGKRVTWFLAETEEIARAEAIRPWSLQEWEDAGKPAVTAEVSNKKAVLVAMRRTELSPVMDDEATGRERFDD